ncbi:MAG TPA: serine/threonine-protein kinase [candidate division Zixibacteria bacterium]|nr:serine/threonine-protein kinase [candidate division Zixibacteria bacterium]
MSNRGRFIFYLFLTLVVIGVKLLNIEALDQIEWRFQDMVYDFKQAGDPSEQVVVVAIDDRAVDEIGAWPWPGEALADLVAAIGAGEARTALIDFPYPERSSESDSAVDMLAHQLMWMQNVTVAYPIVPAAEPTDTIVNPPYLFRHALVTNSDLGTLTDEQAVAANAVALPDNALCDAASRLGFSYSQPDPDNVLRSDPLVMNYHGYYYPSAPLAAAAHFLGVQPQNVTVNGGQSVELFDREISTDRHGRMLLNFPTGGGFKVYSAADVLNQRVDFKEFAEKLVIITMATAARTEYYVAPTTDELPHYIKTAVAVDNILNKNYLKRADSQLSWYILGLALIGVIFAFGLQMISSLYRVVVVALGLIVLANVNYFLFTSFNMMANSIYVALLLVVFLIASPLTALNFGLVKKLFGRGAEEGEESAVEAEVDVQPVANPQWRRMSAAEAARSEEANATVALTAAVARGGDANATMFLGSSGVDAANETMVLPSRGAGAENVDLGATMLAPTASKAPAAPAPAPGYGDISASDLDIPVVSDKPAARPEHFDPGSISLDDKPVTSVSGESISANKGVVDLDAPASPTAPPTPESVSSEPNEAEAASVEPALESLPNGVQQLGRYQLQGILGKGAMGLVYRGIDPAINRPVALKTIRLDFLTDATEIEEMKERLFLEAQAAGKMSHPNIVTIYDVGNEGSTQYIAMEFLQGQTLESMIKRKVNFNFKIVANIIHQICSALQYAHDQGIVHRDVKPANIMILPDFSVKVMDFGIARVDSSGMTKTGVAMGTPNYISPEQLQGKVIDGRSDLFSLGVVFYEMLLGARPFKGENLTSLMYSIMNDEPQVPSKINPRVPPLFDMIIKKALQKEPLQRYQKASEMANALSDFVKSF